MQAIYRTAEQSLFRAVMTNLYKSPLFEQLERNIFDRMQTDIGIDDNGNNVPQLTYVVAGETNTLPTYRSNGHIERIAITFHLFHRNNDNQHLVVDETRGLLSDLSYYAQQAPIMDYYSCKETRIDTQQVITDVDGQTQHGILRIAYTVDHKLRYKN